MNYFLDIFLLAFALVRVANSVFPVPQNVFDLISRSHLSFQDPANSMGCFSDYIVKSNDVNKAYGRDYSQCLLEAKTGRQTTEAEMVSKRIAIGKISQDISKRLSTCDSQNTTLEVFDCHAKIGANNTKAIYGISGNASDNANILQEKYRILDMRHEQCCKDTERNYVEHTADNYRNLKNCLEGRITPSRSTSTEMITTTGGTTPLPTTRSSTTAALVSSTTKAKPSMTFAKRSLQKDQNL